MERLARYRIEEALCRERAAACADNRLFWLNEAEQLSQRALDEIAFQFRERPVSDDQQPRAR